MDTDMEHHSQLLLYLVRMKVRHIWPDKDAPFSKKKAKLVFLPHFQRTGDGGGPISHFIWKLT